MSSATKPFTVSLDTSEGSAFNIDDSTDTTPGSTQTLFTEVIASGKVLKLHRLKVSCTMSSSYQLYEDSDLIGSGECGAGHKDSHVVWTRPREIAATKTLKLEFLQPQTSPTHTDPVVTLSYHLNASLVDA